VERVAALQLERDEGTVVQYWKRKGLRLSGYRAEAERAIAIQKGDGSHCTKWER
jgi:hypothetical protein